MKWLLSESLDSQGMTLIETLVASALLSITALAIGTSVMSVRKASGLIRFQGQMEQTSLGFLQEISNNATQYMINFRDTNDAIDLGGVFPMDATLPLAYSNEWYGNAEDCGTCPGRMGFVIQPLYGYRGMYRATVRSNGEGAMGEKELTFITGGDF